MSDDDNDSDTEAQKRFAREYMRLNRIFFISLFVISVAITCFFPTRFRLAGLAIVSIIAISMFLLDRVSGRAAGFIMLAGAVLAAILTKFVRPDWPIHPEELGVYAANMGALATALIFANKRSGEPNTRMQDIVGWCVSAGLLVVASAVWIFKAKILTNPLLYVACESLAAFADVAGERWKVRLSVGAGILMSVLLLVGAPANSYRPLVQTSASAYRFVAAYVHDWMLWPMLFVGLNVVYIGFHQKWGFWRSLFFVCVLVGNVWLLLHSFDK